jgi:hypothetical protein
MSALRSYAAVSLLAAAVLARGGSAEAGRGPAATTARSAPTTGRWWNA